MKRTNELIAVAILLSACEPKLVEDSGEADSTDTTDGDDCMPYEGQCFQPITGVITKPMAAADLDGDGRAELVVYDSSRLLTRFEWLDDGLVQVGQIYTSLDDATPTDHIAFADLDGDGQREIVVAQDSLSGVYRVQGGAMMEIAVQEDLHRYPRAVGPLADGRELLLAADGLDLASIAAFEWQDDALVKTSTLGSEGCEVSNESSVSGDFDGNGVRDALFAFSKVDCPPYPNENPGLRLVLVQADGSFQNGTWHPWDALEQIAVGELDGSPGDELLLAWPDRIEVFWGGPGFDTFVPNQTIEHIGLIGNLGGDASNEIVRWEDGAIVANPLGSPVVQPFFGEEGSLEFLADFNGDQIDDVVIDLDLATTVWVSK